MEIKAHVAARAALLFVAICLANPLKAAEYKLAVQPVLSPERTLEVYSPLAEYLSEVTGEAIRLVTAKNFFLYWVNMKRGEYDLVFDAGHFTDYRVRHMGHEPLVKLPGEVSYCLVTRGDAMIVDAEELVARPVAVMASPGLGMLRLVEMFPSSMQQPSIHSVESTEEAVEKVRSGEVDAAMVPSMLVGNYPDLVIVRYTDPIPAPALTAGPAVPAALRERIRTALLHAQEDPKGRAMLEAINFSAFEVAKTSDYEGLSELLKGVWGY